MSIDNIVYNVKRIFVYSRNGKYSNPFLIGIYTSIEEAENYANMRIIEDRTYKENDDDRYDVYSRGGIIIISRFDINRQVETELKRLTW